MESWRENSGEENISVIVGDEFFEEVPDRAVGVRQITVAAPDPMIRTGLTRVNQRGGLRVVNDHEFGIERERGAVLLVVGKKNLKIPGLGLVRLAVQSVMEGFRNVKEFFRALHHVPEKVEIEV